MLPDRGLHVDGSTYMEQDIIVAATDWHGWGRQEREHALMAIHQLLWGRREPGL